MIAQTLTASPESGFNLFEVITFFTTLWALFNHFRIMKWVDIFHATVHGVEAALDSIPKQEKKKLTSIMDKAVPVEIREEVGKAVDKALAQTVKTDLPKLVPVFLILLLPFLGGCVCSAVHDSAVEAKRTADMLHAASVPNPGYTTEAEKEAWQKLWEAHKRAILAIEEATK